MCPVTISSIIDGMKKGLTLFGLLCKRRCCSSIVWIPPIPEPIITPTLSLIFSLSILLFVLVILIAIVDQKDNIIDYFSQAGLITLILNIVMMIVAFYIAKFFASGVSQKKCITIECGLQNGTLAIVVTTSIFGEGSMYIIPAATYSLIMFATSLIFVYFVRKVI